MVILPIVDYLYCWLKIVTETLELNTVSNNVGNSSVVAILVRKRTDDLANATRPR